MAPAMPLGNKHFIDGQTLSFFDLTLSSDRPKQGCPLCSWAEVGQPGVAFERPFELGNPEFESMCDLLPGT